MARDAEALAWPLTTSGYLTGLACPRLLWHEVHAPNLKELEPGVEAQFQVQQESDVAKRAVAELPGERMAPAAASNELLRRAHDGLELVAVRPSQSVKDHDLDGIAMRLWTLRASGQDVPRAFVMHLNRAVRFPGLAGLFVTEDVTALVEPLLADVPARLDELRATLERPAPPAPALVRRCRRPKPCPLFAKCWPAFPEHHVSTLHEVRWKKVEKLIASGRETVDRVDEIETADREARRQIRAVRTRRRIVDDGLRAALDQLTPPVAWLATGSVALAVPAWPQVAPHERVPVQFSVRVTGASGGAAHDWLAEPPADPRPALAEALVRACKGTRTVVVYDAKPERALLRHLAAAVPAYADVLGGLHARMLDLLSIVREYVYDPAFGGDFALARVHSALVPGRASDGGEDDLNDAGEAGALLAWMLLEPERIGGPEARERLRARMLERCAGQALAMVRVEAALAALAT